MGSLHGQCNAVMSLLKMTSETPFWGFRSEWCTLVLNEINNHKLKTFIEANQISMIWAIANALNIYHHNHLKQLGYHLNRLNVLIAHELKEHLIVCIIIYNMLLECQNNYLFVHWWAAYLVRTRLFSVMWCIDGLDPTIHMP